MATVPVPIQIVRGNIGLGKIVTGAVLVPYKVDAATGFDLTFDFTMVEERGLNSPIQALQVDNRLNPSPILVTVSQTQQTFPIPPYSAGVLPVASQPKSTIQLVTAGGLIAPNTESPITLQFYNLPLAPIMYAGFAPFVAGSTVAMFGQDAATPMTRTNPLVVEPWVGNPVCAQTVVGIADAIIIPANANGRIGRIRNIGDAAGVPVDAYYNVNAAAVAARGSSFYLPANGQWENFPSRMTQDVHAIADANTIIEIQYWS